MSRTGGLVAIVLIAALCVVWWQMSGGGEANEQNQAAPAREVVDAQHEPDDPAPPPPPSAVSSGAEKLRSVSDERYLVTMGDPILEPRSVEEVEWLRRNLFPNAAARADAARFASELDFDSRDGFEAIEILAAEQFARQHVGNRSKAVKFLNEAAISGSAYALEALARLSESPVDRVTSEAYHRAAALRGNWNAHLRIRPELTADQDILASLLAHQVLENLQAGRRQRGLPQFTVDPRPGLEEFLRGIKEAERAAAAAGR